MAHPSYIYRHKRRTVISLTAILLLMIYFFKDSSFVLRAISTIAFITFFYFVDRFFDVRFKIRHYVFIIAIAIFSLMFSPLYFVHPQYDKVQHFIQPILASSIIFYMITKLNIPLKWKLVFTFFVGFGIVGLMEIGEYGLDYLFDLKLQGVYLRDLKGFEKFNIIQNPIDDTMIDMALGVIGSLVYVSYIGVRNFKELVSK